MKTVKQEALELAAELNESGSPSFGSKAERLWEILSRPYVFTGEEAAKLYRKAGYKPFSGYPLTRETYFNGCRV